jgi:hypothetical protein
VGCPHHRHEAFPRQRVMQCQKGVVHRHPWSSWRGGLQKQTSTIKQQNKRVGEQTVLAADAAGAGASTVRVSARSLNE